MAVTIITPDDLQNFKLELLAEMERLLSQGRAGTVRRWLKSHEVRRLLALSPGTLQNLRINGTLPFSKIGGVIFYDYDDILKMIEDNKRRPQQKWRNAFWILLDHFILFSIHKFYLCLEFFHMPESTSQSQNCGEPSGELLKNVLTKYWKIEGCEKIYHPLTPTPPAEAARRRRAFYFTTVCIS